MFCHDKHVCWDNFCCRNQLWQNCLLREKFVVTSILLSWQKVFCHDKHTFVTTKLLSQKKIILALHSSFHIASTHFTSHLTSQNDTLQLIPHHTLQLHSILHVPHHPTSRHNIPHHISHHTTYDHSTSSHFILHNSAPCPATSNVTQHKCYISHSALPFCTTTSHRILRTTVAFYTTSHHRMVIRYITPPHLITQHSTLHHISHHTTFHITLFHITPPGFISHQHILYCTTTFDNAILHHLIITCNIPQQTTTFCSTLVILYHTNAFHITPHLTSQKCTSHLTNHSTPHRHV